MGARAHEAGPGRGAAHVAPPEGAYVYVVRSRRTGRVSVGVDLTPGGACPFRCDYCQVARGARTPPPETIDLARLERELSKAIAEHGASAGDVAFAGSGEPTSSASFAEALLLARAAVRGLARPVPVRVFTSGWLLGRPHVRRALAELVAAGEGEVWVKLDAWDEASLRSIAGVKGWAAHEARLARFARGVPVVVQAMIARRPWMSEREAGAGIAGAVARLLAAGARIERVVLSTVTRATGDGSRAVEAVNERALADVAARICDVGVAVALPAT